MITFLQRTICIVLFSTLCAGVLSAQIGNPVKSLTGNCNNNGTVTLNWAAPDIGTSDGFWLTYSSNDVMGTIGTQQEGEIRSVARFTASDLTQKGVTVGDKIAMLQYVLNKADCSDFKLQVYDGGMLIPLIGIFLSGTQRVDQPVDLATVGNGWTTTILTNPHTIDLSKELWFGYSVYANEMAMPLGYDWGPGVENKSDLIWAMSTLGIGLWTTLYAATQNQYNLNACIKAYITKHDIPILKRYDIYCEGAKIGETTSRNYTIDGVLPGQYEFCVVAVYENSLQSTDVCVTVGCKEVCDPVKNFAVSYSEDCEEVTLTWTVPGSYAFPLQYNVFRNGDLIAATIEETTFIDDTFDKTVEHTWNIETVCPTLFSNKINKSLPACYIGVNEFLNSISIYPNPASQTVTVLANNFQKIEIYNALGQLIEVKTSHRVNVSNYSSGIYIFKVYDTDDNVANRRITVQGK